MQKKWIILIPLITVGVIIIGLSTFIYYRQQNLSHFSGFIFDDFEFSGFAGCNQREITSLTDAGKSNIYEQYHQLKEYNGQLIYIEFDGRYNGKGTSGLGIEPWHDNIDLIKLTMIKKTPYTVPLFCNAKHPMDGMFMAPPALEFVPDKYDRLDDNSASEPTK